jgi:hypothetical protein
MNDELKAGKVLVVRDLSKTYANGNVVSDRWETLRARSLGDAKSFAG